jgi:hypothetical protein
VTFRCHSDFRRWSQRSHPRWAGASPVADDHKQGLSDTGDAGDDLTAHRAFGEDLDLYLAFGHLNRAATCSTRRSGLRTALEAGPTPRSPVGLAFGLPHCRSWVCRRLDSRIGPLVSGFQRWRRRLRSVHLRRRHLGTRRGRSRRLGSARHHRRMERQTSQKAITARDSKATR